MEALKSQNAQLQKDLQKLQAELLRRLPDPPKFLLGDLINDHKVRSAEFKGSLLALRSDIHNVRKYNEERQKQEKSFWGGPARHAVSAILLRDNFPVLGNFLDEDITIMQRIEEEKKAHPDMEIDPALLKLLGDNHKLRRDIYKYSRNFLADFEIHDLKQNLNAIWDREMHEYWLKLWSLLSKEERRALTK